MLELKSIENRLKQQEQHIMELMIERDCLRDQLRKSELSNHMLNLQVKQSLELLEKRE